MGNANGREDTVNGGSGDPAGRSNGDLAFHGSYPPNSQPPPPHVPSSDSMANSPPPSPGRSRSPHLFAPQAAALALKTYSADEFNIPKVFSQVMLDMWREGLS